MIRKSAPTMARMIKLKRDGPNIIVLPTEFIKSLTKKSPIPYYPSLQPERVWDVEDPKWALLILTSVTKIVRFIPAKSPTIIKVTINYLKSNDFLQELGIVFMRNKIKTLYSTGYCFACDPPCSPMEGYIDLSDLSISTDQLKSELLALTNIVNVEITNLDVNNFR